MKIASPSLEKSLKIVSSEKLPLTYQKPEPEIECLEKTLGPKNGPFSALAIVQP